MFLRLSKTEATTLDKRKIHYSVGYCKSWYILKNSNVGNVRHILQKKKYPDSDMLRLSYYILYLLSTMNSLVEKKCQYRSFWKGEIILFFIFFCIYSSSYIITSRCSFPLPPQFTVPLDSKIHFSFISHQK